MKIFKWQQKIIDEEKNLSLEELVNRCEMDLDDQSFHRDYWEKDFLFSKLRERLRQLKVLL